jgi:hypothetical protein
MTLSYLDFLSPADLPIPQDRPFGVAEARDCLGGWRGVGAAVAAGLLTQPLRGVYVVPTVPDDLASRLAAVRLVAPPDAVVCDRTAAWLHGAPMALAPGSHLATPAPQLYLPPGRRLRNAVVESGARELLRRDIVEVDGLRVTSPLRTACDLGRLLHRDQALAALDSMLRSGTVTKDELLAEVERFRGYRGVLRLRELAPLADGRSASPGESILRLRWIDCSDLPTPDLQVEVPTAWGTSYSLDLGVPEICYSGEYDGAEWHGEEHREHDAHRRRWIAEDQGWTIDVFVGANVHGPLMNADILLRDGVRRALAARRTTWYCV